MYSPRILNVKDSAVTQGVLDKDVQVQPHLIEVTYADALGTPHTIFYHRDGEFDSPEAAVQAHMDGTLHDTDEKRAEDAQPAHPAGPVFE